MPDITIPQLALITILVFTCIITSVSTDHNTRAIRNQIARSKKQLANIKTRKGVQDGEIKEVQKSLNDLEKELAEARKSSFFPSLPQGGSLSAKIRSSLPYIAGIIVGVVVGAIAIMLIPIYVIVVIFTIAALVGSSGLLSEFVRGEKKALALSVIPAGLYALTQVFVLLGLYDLFDLVFWLFDIVVVLALIGVSMILGKELQLEIVIIIVAILTAWDIYAVLFSPIMGSAVANLGYTLFSVLIPSGTGYSLLGGGDFFFSYLLVTAFTRRLKVIPVALIILIGASVTGLVVVMAISGLKMAPALPAVLVAGLLATVYYRSDLRNQDS
jgi:hypothetical protein